MTTSVHWFNQTESSEDIYWVSSPNNLYILIKHTPIYSINIVQADRSAHPIPPFIYIAGPFENLEQAKAVLLTLERVS